MLVVLRFLGATMLLAGLATIFAIYWRGALSKFLRDKEPGLAKLLDKRPPRWVEPMMAHLVMIGAVVAMLNPIAVIVMLMFFAVEVFCYRNPQMFDKFLGDRNIFRKDAWWIDINIPIAKWLMPTLFVLFSVGVGIEWSFALTGLLGVMLVWLAWDREEAMFDDHTRTIFSSYAALIGATLAVVGFGIFLMDNEWAVFFVLGVVPILGFFKVKRWFSRRRSPKDAPAA